MQLRPRRREEPEIVVIPLIDVLLMLLIFFMVATTFNRMGALNIVLPEADSSTAVSQHRSVNISIDADGRYYVNRQEVINTELDTLKQAIATAAGDDTTPQIVLQADRRTQLQSVVRAMDAARQLGFVHITFATSQPPEGQ